MSSTVAETAAQRLAGGQPSRTKAFITAALAASATGILVYKLLRSGG